MIVKFRSGFMAVNKVAFLIVNYNVSGGMNMVLHYASYLQGVGYDVSFVSEEPLPAHLDEWFSKAGNCKRLSYGEAAKEAFDLAIVTFWSLLFHIPSFPAQKFVNFVQRIEYEPLESAMTKKLVYELSGVPLDTIAVSSYICDTLINKHDLPEDRVSVVFNGINKKLFYSGKTRNDYQAVL